MDENKEKQANTTENVCSSQPSRQRSRDDVTGRPTDGENSHRERATSDERILPVSFDAATTAVPMTGLDATDIEAANALELLRSQPPKPLDQPMQRNNVGSSSTLTTVGPKRKRSRKVDYKNSDSCLSVLRGHTGSSLRPGIQMNTAFSIYAPPPIIESSSQAKSVAIVPVDAQGSRRAEAGRNEAESQRGERVPSQRALPSSRPENERVAMIDFFKQGTMVTSESVNLNNSPTNEASSQRRIEEEADTELKLGPVNQHPSANTTNNGPFSNQRTLVSGSGWPKEILSLARLMGPFPMRALERPSTLGAIQEPRISPHLPQNCITHAHIARNIHNHQMSTKTYPSLQTALVSTTDGARAANLNVVTSPESRGNTRNVADAKGKQILVQEATSSRMQNIVSRATAFGMPPTGMFRNPAYPFSVGASVGVSPYRGPNFFTLPFYSTGMFYPSLPHQQPVPTQLQTHSFLQSLEGATRGSSIRGYALPTIDTLPRGSSATALTLGSAPAHSSNSSMPLAVVNAANASSSQQLQFIQLERRQHFGVVVTCTAPAYTSNQSLSSFMGTTLPNSLSHVGPSLVQSNSNSKISYAALLEQSPEPQAPGPSNLPPQMAVSPSGSPKITATLPRNKPGVVSNPLPLQAENQAPAPANVSPQMAVSSKETPSTPLSARESPNLSKDGANIQTDPHVVAAKPLEHKQPARE